MDEIHSTAQCHGLAASFAWPAAECTYIVNAHLYINIGVLFSRRSGTAAEYRSSVFREGYGLQHRITAPLGALLKSQPSWPDRQKDTGLVDECAAMSPVGGHSVNPSRLLS